LTAAERTYKARFHHFGAMIQESRILIEHFQPQLEKKEWINQVIQNNVLGKNSRVWIKELISGVFYPRYVNSTFLDGWQTLKQIINNNSSSAVITSLMYYLTAKSDEFLYDYVIREIYERYDNGYLSVAASDVYDYIQRIPREKFNGQWSDYTQKRLSRGIMATLRDFGILEGKAHKKISNYYLPLEALLIIAFNLKSEVPSGEKILEHPDWKLFLLNTKLVERMFLEAHQQHYLNYQAAGAIIRIEFPFQNSGELVNAISSSTPGTTRERFIS